MSKTEETMINPVKEVNPLDMIEDLQNDLRIAVTGLRRIAVLNPRLIAGGPGNRAFGRRFQRAFERSVKEANDTLKRLADGE